MKLLKSIAILLLVAKGYAQEYTASAKLSGIEADGIYRIPLDPTFRSFSDANPAGIRILDKNKAEVPYYMERLGGVAVHGFERTKILSASMKDSVTSLVIENPGHGITLAIANSDVIKTYNISGSNNLKDWYGLRDKQVLDGLSNPEQVVTYKTFSLPVNDYRYIRFDFDDRKTLPINIVAAGWSQSKVIAPKLQEAAGAVIKRSEIRARKVTRIDVTFDNIAVVDRIVFDVIAPQLYKREGRIIVRKSRKQRNQTKYYDDVVSTFQLSAGNQRAVDLHGFAEREFYIEIENMDNPPLTINTVRMLQLPVSLVAELKSGEQYTVVAGDQYFAAASYDIGHFKDSLPGNLPTASMLEATPITTAKKKDHQGNGWVMWVCIGIGAMIVLYFSITMVRDMKKEEVE